MELTKSSSLTNVQTISAKQISSSLPNLHTSSSSGCPSCSPSTCAKVQLTHCSSTTKVIPTIFQKTWNKIKSMNKKRPTSSAPPTPNSLQKFDFDEGPSSSIPITTTIAIEDREAQPQHQFFLQGEDEYEDETDDPIQQNYVRLQKRLSEELHQGQMLQNFSGGRQNYFLNTPNGSSNNNKTKYCVSEEFRKKLQQWEMWKVSCGKVTYTEEELKQILPEDFSRKLREWENIRSGSPSAVTNTKIEKQIQWLERQLEKVEQEKSKLETQMRKYLEKEARLEKMREALKNYPREQVLIKTPTAEGFAAAGVDEKFTKKLYEWEEMRGIPAEDGSMALLHPKYYHPVGGSSSISSETPETEDVQETSHDEPEPNTPDMSSSLESINQASGSNTSSADFYQKSRRRSSDAVSTPLSARSPSLSAFTSDDEDNNAGLLKTVKEDAAEELEQERPEPPPNPVVRVNKIVVEDDDDDDDDKDNNDGKGNNYFTVAEEPKCTANVFVPTKRTILKPIETDPSPSPPSSSLSSSAAASPSSEFKDLRSPGLIRSISFSGAGGSGNRFNHQARPPNLQHSTSAYNNAEKTTENQSPSPGNSPTKLRAEDIWNKNIDASPPPIRDGPKVVGFIPKLPPMPHNSNASSQSPAALSTSASSIATSNPQAYPNFTSCYIQKPVFQHDGLKNFPRMGKAPVWVSPLVARRKMNSAHSSSFRGEEFRQRNNNEFTLDKFLENSNLNLPSLPGCSSSSSKYTIGGGIPPQDSPVRLVSLSRSSSFGLGRLPSSTEPLSPPESPPVPSPLSTPLNEQPVPSSSSRVCKSKSASSIFKSSLNLFSKVRRSETLHHNNNPSGPSTGNNSNNNEPGQPVKVTRARWFLNRF